jgi:hypothetical protein
MIHYRYDGAAFQTSPLTPLGGDMYQAILPPAACGTTFEYYFSFEGSKVGEIVRPEGAPDSVYTSLVGELVTVFFDNFHFNRGWSVDNTNLADGAWERGEPVGGGERGDPPSAFGGSGECYLTGNRYGDSDVDDGSTTLISPIIDLSEGDARIEYARWYSNRVDGEKNGEVASVFGDFTDVLVVSISNDNGANWIRVETVGRGAEGSGGWYEHAFRVSDYVAPTGDIRVSFRASDYADPSVVEAAIDDFSVSLIECGPGCCGLYTGGYTGNVDCDTAGERNLADITALVDRIYVSKSWLCCEDNGNTNGDADGELNLADIIRLIDHVYVSHAETAPCP